MTETVKDAAGFECLMEKRHKQYHWNGGFSVLVDCEPDGKITDTRAKRKVCELQKIALGSETAFVICEPVGVCPHDVKWDDKIVYKRGDMVRYVSLKMCQEEYADYRRLIIPLCEGKPGFAVHDPFGGITDGVACAFPGGCDP